MWGGEGGIRPAPLHLMQIYATSVSFDAKAARIGGEGLLHGRIPAVELFNLARMGRRDLTARQFNVVLR